eukprot:6476089-Amphidinium_carterae.3
MTLLRQRVKLSTFEPDKATLRGQFGSSGKVPRTERERERETTQRTQTLCESEGIDLEDLYLTTARESMPKEEAEAATHWKEKNIDLSF